jgi:hypothetical protein
MPVLKYWNGSAWVEVAGTGPGVPAGGTAGQVLTKTSAADYAAAWGTNQPILANNTYLQGYKADGTTVQNLIGMTTADEVSIAPSLAAGKAIKIGGVLQLPSDVWHGTSGGVSWLMHNSSDNTLWMGHTTNNKFNGGSGTSSFGNNVEIAGTLYKTGVGAYTFPDHVLEMAYTGKIEQYADAPGAAAYTGLWPLTAVEDHMRTHWRLPHHAPRVDGRVDVMRRLDDLLAECERVYLYLLEHERRLAALETR